MRRKLARVTSMRGVLLVGILLQQLLERLDGFGVLLETEQGVGDLAVDQR